MKQVNSNPTANESITLSTYAFTATDEGGVVAMANAEQLERGQSVFLDITGGNAMGFEEDVEYFVIPVDDTHIALAATREDAFDDVAITTNGNAGAGTVYPTYRVGGVLYVGTGGTLYLRGLQGKSFSPHVNIPDGTVLPFMIKDVLSQGSTASDLVIWSN
jgi:co-chaperonin GroES (HSP10)